MRKLLILGLMTVLMPFAAQAADKPHAIPPGVLPDTIDPRHDPSSQDSNYWMAEPPLKEEQEIRAPAEMRSPEAAARPATPPVTQQFLPPPIAPQAANGSPDNAAVSPAGVAPVAPMVGNVAAGAQPQAPMAGNMPTSGAYADQMRLMPPTAGQVGGQMPGAPISNVSTQAAPAPTAMQQQNGAQPQPAPMAVLPGMPQVAPGNAGAAEPGDAIP